MAKDDFNRPFSWKGRRVAVKSRPVLAPALIAAALIIAVISGFWVAVVDDPNGGRPLAVAVIGEAPKVVADSRAEPEPAATPELPDGDQLESLMAQPTPAASANLIELSASGPLPRISPDGQRPRNVYARRPPAADPSAPRLVLVVSGMGISQTGTQGAIEALPEDVTLAFAPYGASLQRWVDMAREEGHEVLLQIPLEPVGYPKQNPGEHTLLVSTDRNANQQDLEWNLSRMTSYAGVMNYMGARFTSDDQALASFLGEIGERGLFYLDDGSSPKSRAATVGEALQVPVVTADLLIDQDRDPSAIAGELGALEAIARTRGLAIGIASAFPASIEAIKNWLPGALARGVVIVPASAAFPP